MTKTIHPKIFIGKIEAYAKETVDQGLAQFGPPYTTDAKSSETPGAN